MILLLLIHLGLGAGLGLLTSLPPGVANLAVVDAGLRKRRRQALGIAAGGAIADTLQACIAFAGISPALDRHPSVPGALFIASGVLITAYGLHRLRSSPGPQARARRNSARGGMLLGLLLTLLNPAALLAWIVVAAAIAPSSLALTAATAIGVGAGAFLCLATLGYLASRGRDVLAKRATSLSHWIGAALVLLGIVSLARGVYVLLG